MRFARRRFLIFLVAAAGCLPKDDYDPPAQPTAFVEGQRQFLNGNYEKAAKSFQRSVTTNSRPSAAAEANYWVGACRLKQGRYGEAERAFRRCLARAADNVTKLKAWTGIGDCYRLEGSFHLAAYVYERVLRTRSADVERDLIGFNRGVCLLRNGDAAAAKKQLENVVREYPLSHWGVAAKEKLKFAGSFTVQTGSFGTRANAEKQFRKLRAKGFKPRMERSSGNYCVRVGNVPEWQDAVSLGRRLRAAGFDAVCLP